MIKLKICFDERQTMNVNGQTLMFDTREDLLDTSIDLREYSSVVVRIQDMYKSTHIMGVEIEENKLGYYCNYNNFGQETIILPITNYVVSIKELIKIMLLNCKYICDVFKDHKKYITNQYMVPEPVIKKESVLYNIIEDIYYSDLDKDEKFVKWAIRIKNLKFDSYITRYGSIYNEITKEKLAMVIEYIDENNITRNKIIYIKGILENENIIDDVEVISKDYRIIWEQKGE